jgi:hypothetical protein
MSGEEQEPEPDLEPHVQRFIDNGFLPPPQVRALSPQDDTMTGEVRFEDEGFLPPPRDRSLPRSEGTATDTEPVVTMSGGEVVSDLGADIAAVIDDDIVSDLGRDVDPNDEASSIGGRSASNLWAVVGQTQNQVRILGRLRARVREGGDQPEERNELLGEWKDTGACVNYDLMADSHIHWLMQRCPTQAGIVVLSALVVRSTI